MFIGYLSFYFSTLLADFSPYRLLNTPCITAYFWCCLCVCLGVYTVFFLHCSTRSVSLLITVSVPPTLIIALQNSLICSPPNDSCCSNCSYFAHLCFPMNFLITLPCFLNNPQLELTQVVLKLLT